MTQNRKIINIPANASHDHVLMLNLIVLIVLTWSLNPENESNRIHTVITNKQRFSAIPTSLVTRKLEDVAIQFSR